MSNTNKIISIVAGVIVIVLIAWAGYAARHNAGQVAVSSTAKQASTEQAVSSQSVMGANTNSSSSMSASAAVPDASASTYKSTGNSDQAINQNVSAIDAQLNAMSSDSASMDQNANPQ